MASFAKSYIKLRVDALVLLSHGIISEHTISRIRGQISRDGVQQARKDGESISPSSMVPPEAYIVGAEADIS